MGKKFISFILCCCAVLVILTFGACNKEKDDPVGDETIVTNIAVDITDDSGTFSATIKNTDGTVSLSANVVYIFKIYLSPANGARVITDAAISFDYDSNFISIEDCDFEDEINNTFNFVGLQATESTVLTISVEGATASKDISITLV